MGMLEDVIKALERIPAWKRLTALPNEVVALNARVQALEDRLAPATGDQCPKCRVMSFRLEKSGPAPGGLGDLGLREDQYLCAACGYADLRQRNPG